MLFMGASEPLPSRFRGYPYAEDVFICLTLRGPTSSKKCCNFSLHRLSDALWGEVLLAEVPGASRFCSPTGGTNRGHGDNISLGPGSDVEAPSHSIAFAAYSGHGPTWVAFRPTCPFRPAPFGIGSLHPRSRLSERKALPMRLSKAAWKP